MTAVATPPSVSAPQLSGKRPVGDRIFAIVALAAGLSVLVILVLIAWSTGKEAWPIFRDDAAGFLFNTRWAPSEGEFGMLAFLFGTLVTSILALIFAVPLSIGIALFMTEVAPSWLKTPVIYVMDLLSVVPSVVFGLWGVLVLATPISHFYTNVSNVLSPIPIIGGLFAEPVNGRSFFTAGLILAIMIVPIITSLTREVFDTTPRSEKEAALALGATRWEMIRGSVFAHSKGGMVGAVTLGLGRAMGETIAVALVIGSSPQITEKLFSPGYSMPSVIANEFGESSGNYRGRAHRARRGAVHHHDPREPRRPDDRQPLAREVEGRMTATAHTHARPAEIDVIDLSPKRSGRRVRNGIATALMGFVRGRRPRPAALRPRQRDPEGRVGASRGASSPTTSRPSRRHGPGMGPAVVGTIVITATAAAMAVPLGILGAIYLHEYGKTGQARPGAALLRRRDDRRAVDHHGPVHLHDLGRALRRRTASRLRRGARARLPDAADRHPLDRGDAEARARRPARGQLRARGRARPGRSSRRAARRRFPAS